MTTRINGWAYIRVSTDEQLRSTLGVKGYIEKVCRYADAHGVDLGKEVSVIVDGVYFNSREGIVIESISATKVPFLRRPEGRRLANSLKPGDVLLIPEFTRMFRNHREGREVTDLFLDAGIRPVFLDIGGMDFDLSSGLGVVVFALHAYFAEQESKKISERVTQAHRVSRQQGRPAIHNAPTGFRWHGQGKDRMLQIDPEQISLLRQIAGWIDQRWGFEKIYNELRRLNITAIGRSPADMALWGDELRERTVRRWMRKAREMRDILMDTSLTPEDGQAWLDEKYRLAEIEREKREKKLQERRAAAARKKLERHLARA